MKSKGFFIIFILFLMTSIAAYAYYTPYKLHAQYQGKDPLYEFDTISKEDFKVYATSRFGRLISIDHYRISSPIVSHTGLVSITSQKPHLGTLVDLKSISVKDSYINYNKKCYAGKIGEYDSKVKEVLRYEDGREVVNEDLEINYYENDEKENLMLEVNGKNGTYKETIPLIKMKIKNHKEVTFPKYGSFRLLYSKKYHVKGVDRLNSYMGVTYFNHHRETYYSIREIGGFRTNLYIPGKHIAKDGTIRDKDGYICVASNYRFCSPYEVVLTTLGPAKVYDTGCPYGTIDLYVNW